MTRSICKTESALPPLPFGRKRAISFDDAATVSRAQTESRLTKIDYFGESREQTEFAFSYASVRSSTIQIVATTSTAMQFKCEDAPSGVLLIPFLGSSIARQGGQEIEWGGDRSAIYLPPGSTSGQGQARQVLGIDIQPDRIQRTAQVMLGNDVRLQRSIDLNSFRALSMKFGKLKFGALFGQYAATVDAMDCDATRLEQSGVAEMILRSSIMLMVPELFLDADPSLRATGEEKISGICEYIEANLHTRITLTDLERLSGLSSRSLQYAFRRSTGKSPMQWILDRRLEIVRQAIFCARDDMTLTAIASEYFSNLGDFAAAYRKRYGELPSQTLRDLRLSRRQI